MPTQGILPCSLLLPSITSALLGVSFCSFFGSSFLVLMYDTYGWYIIYFCTVHIHSFLLCKFGMNIFAAHFQDSDFCSSWFVKSLEHVYKSLTGCSSSLTSLFLFSETNLNCDISVPILWILTLL